MQLERLRGAAEPERLFQAIAGIGPELARRIHDTLEVDTLEALEVAAHDGRLEAVPGIGARRAAAIRSLLASMLQRVRGRPRQTSVEPSVAVLLDVDREYRDAALADRLPRIAPKRFNPTEKPGSPSSIRSTASGVSRLFIPTPREPTSSGARGIGSSYTFIGTINRRDSARS
jgi:putative hydrolase